MFKANTPLISNRQFHVRAYFTLIISASQVIAKNHTITPVSNKQKRDLTAVYGVGCHSVSLFLMSQYIVYHVKGGDGRGFLASIL